MEVIAQYEEELKRVKEELHIYQRRERMNNAQSSPSPSCSTAVEPTKVAPKVILTDILTHVHLNYSWSECLRQVSLR